MTFKIEATSVWHDEDVIKSYPQLSDFAFRCDEEEKPMWQQVGTRVLKKPKIEIESIEDLISLLNSVDSPLVIAKEDDGLSIEIYDYYRE